MVIVHRVTALLSVLALAACVVGCPASTQRETIRIDGSSTVYPVSEAVAEEFRKSHPDVNVTVGLSGTGGGMEKFTAGEIEIADASRGISDGERQKAEAAGIEFLELPVAYDGIAVVVHPENDWCDNLTVDQLKLIWQPDNPAQTWSDLDPDDGPDEEISLYGPGTDSGTFDYFTEEIVGDVGASRGDYAPSEDDNVIVTGVAGDRHALGYFGFAYFAENKGRLKVLGIDNGDGPVTPSLETIMSGEYAPLSRPLFIYVRKDALVNPEVAEFVRFYVENADQLAKEVGYVPVPDDVRGERKRKLEEALASVQTAPAAE